MSSNRKRKYNKKQPVEKVKDKEYKEAIGELTEYIEKHNIANVMSIMLSKSYANKHPDPISFMIDYLIDKEKINLEDYSTINTTKNIATNASSSVRTQIKEEKKSPPIIINKSNKPIISIPTNNLKSYIDENVQKAPKLRISLKTFTVIKNEVEGDAFEDPKTFKIPKNINVAEGKEEAEMNIDSSNSDKCSNESINQNSLYDSRNFDADANLEVSEIEEPENCALNTMLEKSSVSSEKEKQKLIENTAEVKSDETETLRSISVDYYADDFEPDYEPDDE